MINRKEYEDNYRLFRDTLSIRELENGDVEYGFSRNFPYKYVIKILLKIPSTEKDNYIKWLNLWRSYFKEMSMYSKILKNLKSDKKLLKEISNKRDLTSEQVYHMFQMSHNFINSEVKFLLDLRECAKRENRTYLELKDNDKLN